MKHSLFLPLALIVTGFAIMFLGLNIGLGGIKTLGWQSSVPFIEVTNQAAFQVQDSHIRFVGGVWFCVGALFAIGACWQNALRPTLILLCIAIMVAGLFRLSGLPAGAVFSTSVAPSLALELIAFPLLGCWLYRAGRL